MANVVKTFAVLIMPPFALMAFAFFHHHRYQVYAGYAALGVTGIVLLTTWGGIRKYAAPGVKWLLVGSIVFAVALLILTPLSYGALIWYALAAYVLMMTMHLWMLSQAWSNDRKLRVLMPLVAGVIVAAITVVTYARYIVGHVVQVRQEIVKTLPYEVVPIRDGQDPDCQEIRFYLSPPEMTRERELYIYASITSTSIAKWLEGRRPSEARLVFNFVFNLDEVFNGEIIRIDDRELRSLSHCTMSYLHAEEFRRGYYSSGPQIPSPYRRLDGYRWGIPLVAPMVVGLLLIGWQSISVRRSERDH